MTKKNIVLITRTYNNKKIKLFIERIYTELSRIIVLVNYEKELDHYTQNLLSKCHIEIFNKLEIIHVRPWGIASGALNIGLTKAFNHNEKPTQILIASPEVIVNKINVEKMSEILSNDPDMLVVGYALKAFTDDNYNFKRYGGHGLTSIYDVYKAPWNTCAMWDAELFREYIGAFNVICDCSNYLTKKDGKELRGMEDVLAMALAKKHRYKFNIGIIKNHLDWYINKERIKAHEEKMKRKRLVCKEYDSIFNGLPSLNVKPF